MSFQLHIVSKPKKRIKAILIDAGIIGLLILPVLIYSYIERLVQTEQFVLILYLFLYKVAIYLILEVVVPYYNKGRTIGKTIMQIALVQSTGDNARLSHYLKRASLFILFGIIGDVLLLGWIAYVLWTIVVIVSVILLFTDEHRRTIHDFIAGTMVVNATNIMEFEEV